MNRWRIGYICIKSGQYVSTLTYLNRVKGTYTMVLLSALWLLSDALVDKEKKRINSLWTWNKKCGSYRESVIHLLTALLNVYSLS